MAGLVVEPAGRGEEEFIVHAFGRVFARGAVAVVIVAVAVGTGHGAVAVSGSAGSGQAWLYGVSCPARGYCLAVGGRTAGNVSEPLAEVLSAGRWRVVSPPGVAGAADDELYGVSCRARTRCMAVGRASVPGRASAVSVVDLWDGRRWHRVAAMPRGARGVLAGVSCQGAAGCMVVGGASGTGPLSELRTGRGWRLLVTPKARGAAGGSLAAVSCRAVRCAAAGVSLTPAMTEGHGLGESWNGRRWAAAPIPVPDGTGYLVEDVSCGSPSACITVGYTLPAPGPVPFTYQLSRGRWRWLARAAATPAGTALDGISCPARRYCVSVGASGTGSPFAQAWDGASWRVLTALRPPRKSYSVFYGISCPRVRWCLAVGQAGSGGAERTLAEILNGSTWRVLAPPSP
jgi:hypothetical protein